VIKLDLEGGIRKETTSDRTGTWIESYGQCVYLRISGARRIKHRRARNFCDDVA